MPRSVGKLYDRRCDLNSLVVQYLIQSINWAAEGVHRWGCGKRWRELLNVPGRFPLLSRTPLTLPQLLLTSLFHALDKHRCFEQCVVGINTYCRGTGLTMRAHSGGREAPLDIIGLTAPSQRLRRHTSPCSSQGEVQKTTHGMPQFLSRSLPRPTQAG